MSRSKWKGPFLDSFLISRILKSKKLQIWSRRSIIPMFLIGKIVQVHNGKSFQKVTVTRDKVGFKFGSFVR